MRLFDDLIINDTSIKRSPLLCKSVDGISIVDTSIVLRVLYDQHVFIKPYIVGNLDFSGIDPADLIQRLLGAQTAEQRQSIAGQALDDTGLGEQVLSALNLSTTQREVLAQYCSKVGSHTIFIVLVC